jgi:hypothetical protein
VGGCGGGLLFYGMFICVHILQTKIKIEEKKKEQRDEWDFNKSPSISVHFSLKELSAFSFII